VEIMQSGGLGSELSVPLGSKLHTTERQVWRLCHPLATGSVTAVILRLRGHSFPGREVH
jgi:hypothetical protein